MTLAHRQTVSETPETTLPQALGQRLTADFQQQGDLSFSVLPVDASLGDAPTFCVAVREGDVDVATYKFNFFDYADDIVGDCLIACPLVIIWADEGRARKTGMDKTIIDHAVSCLRGFLQKDAPHKSAVFLSSGYLTTQRKGRDFFAALGWDVQFTPRRDGGFTHARLPAHVLHLAQHIDAISLPYRTKPEEADNIHFAFCRIASE